MSRAEFQSAGRTHHRALVSSFTGYTLTFERPRVDIRDHDAWRLRHSESRSSRNPSAMVPSFQIRSRGASRLHLCGLPREGVDEHGIERRLDSWHRDLQDVSWPGPGSRRVSLLRVPHLPRLVKAQGGLAEVHAAGAPQRRTLKIAQALDRALKPPPILPIRQKIITGPLTSSSAPGSANLPRHRAALPRQFDVDHPYSKTRSKPRHFLPNTSGASCPGSV